MRKAVVIEAVLLLCFAFSLWLVLLPHARVMIDFPTYMVVESHGKLTIEAYGLTESEIEEVPKALVGEGFGVGGSLGGGCSSQLHLVHDVPSEEILSLGEEGSVTLTYGGDTIELGVGETWRKTVYHWLRSGAALDPIPALLFGHVVYDTETVRNYGFVDEIMIVRSDRIVRFAEVKPVLVQIWCARTGKRIFVSPNLVIFAFLLGWNTWKMRRRKDGPSAPVAAS